MDAETRMEQQRILAARDTEFVFGEGGVADRIQAELVLRAEGWERSYRRADAEREALARLHEVATQRTVQLAAIIEKAKGAPYHEVIAGGRRTDSVYTILETADTAAVLRERDDRARAEGWDAAVSALRYDDGEPLELASNVNPWRNPVSDEEPTA